MGEQQINLAETADFDLGELRVSPAHREVRWNGERHELEPKVAQVLAALAASRSEVVSRDRLIALCWGGRIVGDDALNRCIVALRHLAKKFSPEPFVIETVPRVGYCLSECPAAVRKSTSGRKLAIIALVGLAAGGASLWIGQSGSASREVVPASIAVLPFRNLSGGEPYFAQGIGEEVQGQLAREPQFRVAGSTSSSEIGAHAGVREASRRLHVNYVLEGSVRTQGDRVRVNASLLRASDDTRLWSSSYDGKLDDVFAIQQQIASEIAGALKRKLVHSSVVAREQASNGEAYSLYLTARALLRTRNRQLGSTAVDLLRDAIRLDPNYAPAWAALASAVRLQGATNFESFLTATRLAQGYARHSLSLSPDLAEAHRSLGEILAYGSQESNDHLLRAAQIAPNLAENWIAIGGVHAAEGKFERELEAYQKAQILDPLWFRTVGSTAIAIAEMGDRAKAEAVARRGFPHNEVQQQIIIGRIAWIFGDYSEAVRRWAIVVRLKSPRWSGTAQRTINDAAHAVGLEAGPLVAVPRSSSQRTSWRIWIVSPPPPAVWRARNRDTTAADVYHDENLIAAKLMLNSGRAKELAATYDDGGLFGRRPEELVDPHQIYATPIVSLALRKVGRGAEADRLLNQADAQVRAVYRLGRVPFWFEADAAAVFAAEGKTGEALSALERAWRRGWRHVSSADLPDINDEPAFRSLHGQLRFERLRTMLAAHNARERREMMLLPEWPALASKKKG